MFDAIYDEAIQATQGGRWDNPAKRRRFRIMCEAAVEAGTDAAWANVGLWNGHSLYMLAELQHDVPVFGVDSFAGLGGFSAADEPVPERHRYFEAAYSSVRSAVPHRHVCLLRGWIPAVFGLLPDQEYSFVAIDVDLHDPTRDSLAYFWPRLRPQGRVYVDDYGTETQRTWPGCKRAVDAFVERTGAEIVVDGATGATVIVKGGE